MPTVNEAQRDAILSGQSVAAASGASPSSSRPSGNQDRGINLGGILRGVGNAIKSNAVPLALTAASLWYQNRQAKKLKRRINDALEERAGIEVRFTPASGDRKSVV